MRLGWAPLARRLSRFVSPSGVCLFGDCLTSRGIKRNPRPPGLSLPSPHRLANPPSLRPSPLAAYLQGAGRRAQRAERESAPAARRSRTVRRPRPMRAALRCCLTARRTAGRGPGRPFLSVGYRGKRARGRDGTGMGQALPLSSVGYRGKRARHATCAGTYGTGTAPFFCRVPRQASPRSGFGSGGGAGLLSRSEPHEGARSSCQRQPPTEGLGPRALARPQAAPARAWRGTLQGHAPNDICIRVLPPARMGRLPLATEDSLGPARPLIPSYPHQSSRSQEAHRPACRSGAGARTLGPSSPHPPATPS